MNDILSYCGLVCNTCPIYLVTREANKEEQVRKRIEIARICREQYGLKYEVANITDCDGCQTTNGRLFSGCFGCVIRKCAKQKAVENCAHCNEYICEQLGAFFIKDPSAKERLEEIRSRIS
ncbi:MAG: DUF3795 domain-containing protein [Bacteroidota bacterium]